MVEAEVRVALMGPAERASHAPPNKRLDLTKPAMASSAGFAAQPRCYAAQWGALA